jgi:hypothetical protein
MYLSCDSAIVDTYFELVKEPDDPFIYSMYATPKSGFQITGAVSSTVTFLFDALKNHQEFALPNALAALVIWATFIPLSALVQFPSFWWMPLVRAAILKVMRFGISSVKSHPDEHNRFRRFQTVVLYSRKFRSLKWIVWIFTCVYFLLLVLHLYAFQVIASRDLFQLAEDAFQSMLRHNINYIRPPDKEIIPVCYTKPRNLTMTQYMALAADTYFERASNVSELIRQSYFSSDSDLVAFDYSPCAGPVKCPMRTYHFLSRGVIVHAIRGMTGLHDVITYMEILVSALFYNVGSLFHPLFESYGRFAKYSYKWALNFPMFAFPHMYFIDDYVTSITERVQSEPSSQYQILIGHSLGGSVAKLVALRTGMASIAISGAGVSAMAGIIHGAENLEVMNTFADILPKNDLLASLDRSAAATYEVPCDAGIGDCHDIHRTLCMSEYMCTGDVSRYCNEHFTVAVLKEIKALWNA